MDSVTVVPQSYSSIGCELEQMVTTITLTVGPALTANMMSKFVCSVTTCLVDTDYQLTSVISINLSMSTTYFPSGWIYIGKD